MRRYSLPICVFILLLLLWTIRHALYLYAGYNYIWSPENFRFLYTK